MKKKTFLGLLAVIIVGGIILAAAIGSSWFKNKDFKTWFNSWGKSDKRIIQQSDEDLFVYEGAVLNDSGEILPAAVSYPLPRSVVFTPRTNTTVVESSTFNVYATVLPENADNKRLEWFSSSPNEVSVAATSEDTHNAQITCLKPFETTITITCRSVDNPAKFAECKVDYLAKVSSVEIYLSGNSGDDLVFGQDRTFSANYFYSTGSVYCEGHFSYNLNLTSAMISEIERITGKPFCDMCVDGNTDTLTLLATPFDSFCGINNGFEKEEFNYAFKRAMEKCDYHATLTVDYVSSYNGKQYYSTMANFDLRFSFDGIWVSVSDVEMGGDDFIFA